MMQKPVPNCSFMDISRFGVVYGKRLIKAVLVGMMAKVMVEFQDIVHKPK